MKLPPLRSESQYPLALLFASMAITALFLLATSLPNLQLTPGERFIMPSEQETTSAGPVGMISPYILQVSILFSAILLLISLFIVIRTPKARKKSLKFLGYLLLYLTALVLVVSNYGRQMVEAEEQNGQPAIAPTPVFISPPDPEEAGQPVTLPQPAPPPLATYIVTLVVILAIGLAGYWIWQLTRSRPLSLQDIAGSALSDLAAGRNWEDVVIQCYAEMSAAASRRRKLDRPQAMTPSEYALRLEQAGLPAHSVRSLTRLFEKARYGSRQSSTDEAQEAVACLSAILQAVESRE